MLSTRLKNKLDTLEFGPYCYRIPRARIKIEVWKIVRKNKTCAISETNIWTDSKEILKKCFTILTNWLEHIFKILIIGPFR